MKNIKKIKSELIKESSNYPITTVENIQDYQDREYSIGVAVSDLLLLKIKNDRIQTSWGSKTIKGLGASILRIVEENN